MRATYLRPIFFKYKIPIGVASRVKETSIKIHITYKISRNVDPSVRPFLRHDSGLSLLHTALMPRRQLRVVTVRKVGERQRSSFWAKN